MPLYKVIDEKTVEKFNNSYVICDGNICVNPSDDVVKGAGYKELADVKQPAFDAKTETLSLTFRDAGDVIVPVWEVTKK